MKNICLVVLLFTVCSCGSLQRSVTSWTGGFTYKCAKTGIEYVQSDSGIAVLLDDSGNVVKCRQ